MLRYVHFILLFSMQLFIHDPVSGHSWCDRSVYKNSSDLIITPSTNQRTLYCDYTSYEVDADRGATITYCIFDCKNIEVINTTLTIICKFCEYLTLSSINSTVSLECQYDECYRTVVAGSSHSKVDIICHDGSLCYIDMKIFMMESDLHMDCWLDSYNLDSYCADATLILYNMLPSFDNNKDILPINYSLNIFEYCSLNDKSDDTIILCNQQSENINDIYVETWFNIIFWISVIIGIIFNIISLISCMYRKLCKCCKNSYSKTKTR